MKANTASPSGNAIVDLESTEATVGEADASISSGGAMKQTNNGRWKPPIIKEGKISCQK